MTAKVIIYVNGIKIKRKSTLKKDPTFTFSWPNYDVNINQLYSIDVYTMPSSLEASIQIGGKEAARINLEIPGERVGSLTSAYSLKREMEFSKNEYVQKVKEEKARKKHKNNPD